MSKTTQLRKLLPHTIVLLIFMMICALFFRGQLEGKVLRQSDIISFKGASKELTDFRKESGEVSLWTNSMFGGMPAYQISSPSPSNLIKKFSKAVRLGIKNPTGVFFTAMLCFYILMLCLGTSPWIAAIGAVAFAFTTNHFVLLEAGHNTKLATLSYFPLVVAGVMLTYRNVWLWGGVLFTLGLALNVSANHPQMTYYLFMALVIYVILKLVRSIREKTLPGFVKASAILLIGAVLAIASSASKIWTTYEYAKDTMRGDPILKTTSASPQSSSETKGLEWNYAMRWSNGMTDLFATVIPGFAGGSGTEKVDSDSAFGRELRKRGAGGGNLQAPLYWGALPFTSGPAYFGVLSWLMFILALLTIRGDFKWWIVGAVLLTLVMSMGKNVEFFNRLLYDTIPLLNKFRAPSSILGVTAFFIPALGFYGLWDILNRKKIDNGLIKKLFIATGITGGFCLIMALVGPSLFDFTSNSDAQYEQYGFVPALIDDRKALLSGDSWRCVILILLAGGLIWTALKKKINPAICVAGIGLLTTFDLWTVGQRYIAPDDFVRPANVLATFNPRPVDEQILKDKDPNYRVLDLSVNTFNSAVESYHHKTIGGYHPAKLQRYQDMIDKHIFPEMSKVGKVLSEYGKTRNDSILQTGMNGLHILNMLNTKYVIYGNAEQQGQLRNPAANGNAWFVAEVVWAADANDEIALLSQINTKFSAIVHQEYVNEIKTSDYAILGKINQTSYAPKRIDLFERFEDRRVGGFLRNLVWT